MFQLASICSHVCIHSILSCASRPLGHHASRCVIGGPRVENYTLLSLCNDREDGCAYMFCKYFAMPLSCPLLQKTRNQQQKLVGRPLFLVFTTKSGRQVVSIDKNRAAARPQIPLMDFQPSGAFCSVLRSIANKGESEHRDGFPDKAIQACMHSLPSKAELRQSISCSLHDSFIACLVKFVN